MNSSYKKAFLFFVAIAALFAATGAHAEVWDDGSSGILDIMYGPLGTTIAVCCVAGAGLGALAGKLEWLKAGAVIAGVIIYFGAPDIVSFFKKKMGNRSASAVEYVMPASRLAMADQVLVSRAA